MGDHSKLRIRFLSMTVGDAWVVERDGQTVASFETRSEAEIYVDRERWAKAPGEGGDR